MRPCRYRTNSLSPRQLSLAFCHLSQCFCHVSLRRSTSSKLSCKPALPEACLKDLRLDVFYIFYYLPKHTFTASKLYILLPLSAPKHTWLCHHRSAAAALHCPKKMEVLQPTIFGPLQGIQLQTVLRLVVLFTLRL